MWKTEKFSLTQKISSNKLFSHFFSKAIAFTKFLRKKCEREFLQFPLCTVYVWKVIKDSNFKLLNVKIWEISFQTFKIARISDYHWFHEIFPSLLFRCLDVGMDPSKVLPPEEAKKIYKKQFKSQKFIESDDDSENKWIFFSLLF